jgi:iron complex outermembrane recepter protein
MIPKHFSLVQASVFIFSGLSPILGFSQTASPMAEKAELPNVVVGVTRSEALAFDTPASINVIRLQTLDSARWNVNLSEVLGSVPGLTANNRNNYAQDLQISSRGFGARTAFGVRGLRILVDGIPGNSPDGQGQVSHIDLGSARQIEVLRGPFSALYGNASGGVINVVTEQGGPDTVWSTTAAGGSSGSYRLEEKISGSTPFFNYVITGSRFGTEGWRQQSAAQRDNLNARLGFRLGPDTQAVFVLNRLDLPSAKDPQGLDLAGLSNPRSVPAAVLGFDTRKSIRQSQAGLDITHRVNSDNVLKLMAYGGNRAVTQYQSTPLASQVASSAAGGVVDFERNYSGTDLRWTWRQNLPSGPFELNAGLAFDRMNEERRGYENFVASTVVNPDPVCFRGTSRLFTCGVMGALRRDETNVLNSSDQYIQLQWWPVSAMSIHAGLRHSRIRLRSNDHYIASGNPDDSGGAEYSGTTPMAGLAYHITNEMNAYASVGRGFDAPTLNEVAYSSNVAISGLNVTLKPARSQQAEVGLKSQGPLGRAWQVALFQATTDNEITVLSNDSGRSRFQNAGRTTRRGAEFSINSNLAGGWSTQWAYTYLNAVYKDPFFSCYIATCTPGAPLPANRPLQVAAGSLLPGIPRQNLFADVVWRRPGGGIEAGFEWRANARVATDDLNTQFAPGYGVSSARLTFTQKMGAWTLKEFVRVDNLAGKNYVSSVIVNQSNKQFFEPAMGRTWLVGLNGAYRF